MEHHYVLKSSQNVTCIPMTQWICEKNPRGNAFYHAYDGWSDSNQFYVLTSWVGVAISLKKYPN